MRFILITIVLLYTWPLQAQSEENRLEHYNLKDDRLAIQGYDPVSYFNNAKPLKGKADLRYEYRGVIYRFATAENLETFRAKPDQYEPAWGGWCGQAMAENGAKVAINPKCYKIIDGRNVLFYKTIWANALKKWNKTTGTAPEEKLMKQGDEYWENTIDPD